MDLSKLARIAGNARDNSPEASAARFALVGPSLEQGYFKRALKYFCMSVEELPAAMESQKVPFRSTDAFKAMRQFAESGMGGPNRNCTQRLVAQACQSLARGLATSNERFGGTEQDTMEAQRLLTRATELGLLPADDVQEKLTRQRLHIYFSQERMSEVWSLLRARNPNIELDELVKEIGDLASTCDNRPRKWDGDAPVPWHSDAQLLAARKFFHYLTLHAPSDPTAQRLMGQKQRLIDQKEKQNTLYAFDGCPSVCLFPGSPGTAYVRLYDLAQQQGNERRRKELVQRAAQGKVFQDTPLAQHLLTRVKEAEKKKKKKQKISQALGTLYADLARGFLAGNSVGSQHARTAHKHAQCALCAQVPGSQKLVDQARAQLVRTLFDADDLKAVWGILEVQVASVGVDRAWRECYHAIGGSNADKKRAERLVTDICRKGEGPKAQVEATAVAAGVYYRGPAWSTKFEKPDYRKAAQCMRTVLKAKKGDLLPDLMHNDHLLAFPLARACEQTKDWQEAAYYYVRAAELSNTLPPEKQMVGCKAAIGELKRMEKEAAGDLSRSLPVTYCRIRALLAAGDLQTGLEECGTVETQIVSGAIPVKYVGLIKSTGVYDALLRYLADHPTDEHKSARAAIYDWLSTIHIARAQNHAHVFGVSTQKVLAQALEFAERLEELGEPCTPIMAFLSFANGRFERFWQQFKEDHPGVRADTDAFGKVFSHFALQLPRELRKERARALMNSMEQWADKGDLYAKVMLGALHLYGVQFEEDRSQEEGKPCTARRQRKKTGKGVSQHGIVLIDVEKALRFLKEAREHGPCPAYDLAHKYLGFAYGGCAESKSKHIARDMEKAEFHYRKAASSGFPSMCIQLAKFYCDKKKELGLSDEAVAARVREALGSAQPKDVCDYASLIPVLIGYQEYNAFLGHIRELLDLDGVLQDGMVKDNNISLLFMQAASALAAQRDAAARKEVEFREAHQKVMTQVMQATKQGHKSAAGLQKSAKLVEQRADAQMADREKINEVLAGLSQLLQEKVPHDRTRVPVTIQYRVSSQTDASAELGEVLGAVYESIKKEALQNEREVPTVAQNDVSSQTSASTKTT